MRRICTLLIGATIAAAGVGEALAQRSSSGTRTTGGSSSSGLFGSRNLGQGTTARSGSSFGSGAGGAASATPGNAVEQVQADAGQASGDERFIRENRAPGTFVGADTADTTTFFSQSSGASLSGLQQFASAAAQRDFQNQNGTSNSRNPLRPRLVLGFSPPADASQSARGRFAQRLAKLPQLEILENVEVSIVGRTAVLRGRVATDRDRALIAQIASLEPGVASVQNDLVVGPANSPQQTAVSTIAAPESVAPPKALLPATPELNSPELAAPPAPRGPRAD